MNRKAIVRVVIAIVICEFAGIIGSIFTVSAIPTWYASLIKPELAPPNWIFGPVWVTLFALMGIAAFLVYSAQASGRVSRERLIALSVFGFQLLLNILWSVIFFGFQAIFLALIEICFLWVAIVLTIVLFARISKLAAWLLLPYIAWVTFATYLTYQILLLNSFK